MKQLTGNHLLNSRGAVGPMGVGLALFLEVRNHFQVFPWSVRASRHLWQDPLHQFMEDHE